MCASKALCAIEKAVWERIKSLSSGHLNSLSWAFELSSAWEKERDTQRQKYIRLQNAYQSFRYPQMMKGLARQLQVTT